MTDQEKEEFEFRLRAEREAAESKSTAEKVEDATGLDLTSPLFGAVAGTVAGIPAGHVIEEATKKAMGPLPRGGAGTGGEKWAKNWAGMNKPGASVPEAAAAYQRAKGHGPVTEKITQRFGPGAKLDIGSYTQAEKAKPFLERVGSRLPEGAQRAGQAVSGAVSAVPKWVGRGIAGGSAGFQGVDAMNRFEQGDYLGGVVSGLGALGSGAALVPHPLIRGVGTAIGAGAPALNALIDAYRERQKSQPAETEFQGYAGGGVAKGGLSLAKKFGYDPAKVAKNYPEVLPGVPTLDPKTGKEFTKKVLSQEAEAVQKARKAAQAEIDKGQYTPFFDVTQRSYVNPADYPLVGRTLTDVLPKKAETIEKYRMLAESPEATARLKAAFAEGSKAPAAKDWYAMKQLEDAFVQELGPEAGKLAFRQRFAEPMAATTGGADPTSNLMMTAYTNFMREKGLPIPSAAHELPFPIGGRYVSGNMEQARRYHQQGSIPIDNPKRHNFASNFMGYRDRPTIDEQMMGLFAPGKGAPEAGTYGVYESALNKLAKEANVEPVNFQDVAWAGAKKYQGKPMMQEINEMIYRTSRVTGETPEEVLKGYIRGNKPMYGLTGLGALAAQEDGGVNNPE